MDNDIQDVVVGVVIFIVMFVLFILFFYSSDLRFNTKQHGEDITVTEWVSPDGVHYWYQLSGYHAMLAPRYDKNGELVIDSNDN